MTNPEIANELVDDTSINYDEVPRFEDLILPRGENGEVVGEIWFAGLNIDKAKIWNMARSGLVEKLADGVFINKVNPPGLPEMTAERRRNLILVHALRIAKMIYKDAPLSGASAFHLSQVEGSVCLASFNNSKYPTRDVGGVLKIYHSHIESGLPIGAPTEQVEIEDTLGTMVVEALPDEVLILQYHTPFRRKPAPQTQLSLGDLSALIERAVIKRGSKDALLVRLTEIAGAMNYELQLRSAQEAINRAFIYTQKRRNQYEYFVFWNKVRAGTLGFDGIAWRFDYDTAFKLKLTLATGLKTGLTPAFIGSVLPEVEQLEALFEDGFTEFRLADRYLSNITIRRSSDATAHNTVFIDQRQGSLQDFQGKYYQFNGKCSARLEKLLGNPALISSAIDDPLSPRMSGVQLKLAGNLSHDGVLSLVSEHKKASFTHIIKPPPHGDRCTVGSIEWMGMTFARLCQLPTEEFAIADVGGYGPTFIAERFDIPREGDEEKMYLLEDFWSIKNLRKAKYKYNGDLVEVGQIIMKFSTDKVEDARILFRQVAFCWLIVNSDLHLKNMMMLKTASSDLTKFESIRLSPCYDILCTNVYRNDPTAAALFMCSTPHYTLSAFRDFGKTMKIGKEEVDNILLDLISRIRLSVDRIISKKNLPEVILNHQPSMDHLMKAKILITRRCDALEREMALDFKGENKIEDEDLEFGTEAKDPNKMRNFSSGR